MEHFDDDIASLEKQIAEKDTKSKKIAGKIQQIQQDEVKREAKAIAPNQGHMTIEEKAPSKWSKVQASVVQSPPTSTADKSWTKLLKLQSEKKNGISVTTVQDPVNPFAFNTHTNFFVNSENFAPVAVQPNGPTPMAPSIELAVIKTVPQGQMLGAPMPTPTPAMPNPMAMPIPLYIAAEIDKGTNTGLVPAPNEYGQCFFTTRFLCQPARIIGSLLGIAALVLYILDEANYNFPHAEDETFLNFILVLYVGPAALLLFVNLIKVKVKNYNFCDCVWPGLHVAANGSIIFVCLWQAFFYCMPIYGQEVCEEGKKCDEAFRQIGCTRGGGSLTYEKYDGGDDLTYVILLIISILGYLVAVLSNTDYKGVMAKPRHSFKDAGTEVYEASQEHPSVTISGEAYHYETRHRTVTDSEGHSRTETYQEKVTTATASESFQYEDVRVVGEVFNTSDFESDPRYCRKINVFSAKFFTVVADQETKDAINAAVSRMYATMQCRDTHASASWGKDDKFLSFTIFPGCADEEAAEKKSFVLRTACVLFTICGQGFTFVCLLGLVANNPVFRYAKEISVKKFTGKQLVVIKSAYGGAPV